MMHSEGLITFKNTDFIEDIQDVMAKKRFRDFPITDENGKYIGMISRRNLLKHGKRSLFWLTIMREARLLMVWIRLILWK